MQIDVRGVEMDITDDVKTYAEEKLNKLTNYGVKILQIDVGIEEDHNKTEDKAAQAKASIKVAGKNIDASGEGENVYAALDIMVDRAKKQLVEHKERYTKRQQDSRTRKLIRRMLRRR